jgi:fructokinase
MAEDVIVVAGEALVDLVPEGPDGGGALRPLLGGGPFNAARAAGRAGARVAFLGRVSGDALGRRVRAVLQDDGVDLAAVVETEAPMTLALAEVGADGGAAYRFYVEGTSAPGLTGAEVAQALRRVREGVGDGARRRVGVLCVGTLGLVFEPSARALEEAVRSADDDVLVVVDPNCRPAAIPDEAAYRARLARILARADVVKASAEDLAWLRPGEPPEAALRALLTRPGAVGLVTLGADGALVLPPGAAPAFAVPAPPVEVVDTIGAGDAFLGGWLAEWQRLAPASLHDLAALRAATEAAVRTAARACERAGA